MTSKHIPHLREALQRGNLTLFIGADLPHAITGLPSRTALASDLARRHGLTESDSLAAVAQQVARHGQRFQFISFLRDQLDTTGTGPRLFHRRVVELVQRYEVTALLTTAYDDLLKRAFEAKGAALDVVVRGSGIQFADPRTPTLIKLYGDLQQPETLVVTEDDHYGLWRDRDKEALLDEVRVALKRNVVLFLGYNLADPDFNLLWREVLDKAGQFAIGAYAAWPDVTDAQKQVWEERHVRVLDLPALELLGELLGTHQPDPSTSDPVPSHVEIIKDPADNYYLLAGDTIRRLCQEATLRDIGMKYGLTIEDVRSVSPSEISQFTREEPIADTTPRVLQSRQDGRCYWVKDGVKQEIANSDTLTALAGDIPPDIVSQEELDQLLPGDAIAPYLGTVAQEARPQLIVGKEWGHQYVRLGQFRRHIRFDVKRQVVETIGKPDQEHSEQDLKNTLIEGLPIQSAEWLIQEWTKRMNQETAAPQTPEVVRDASAYRTPPAQENDSVQRTQPSVYTPLRFHDFELLIGDPIDDGYPIHILASPAGEGEGIFVLPFDETELQDALRRLEQSATDEAFLIDLGTRLFRALFDGDVHARYAESTGATTHNAGLRIRLRLDPQELHQLPWELLYDPEKREFLVLSARAHVTRYLHVPRRRPPLTIEPPLRVLVAVAAPKDRARLDVDAELAHIDQTLCPLVKKGLVMLTVEAHATKRSLRHRLMEVDPHVLHYVGHGGLDRDRGVLLLENDRGLGDPLDGSTLSTLLKRGSVRLAVLNACLSAREVASEGVPPADASFPRRRAAFLGVGPALVNAGLGAVVAMQFSVADRSAGLFAQDFYDMLARFLPVDECIARAREALLLEVGLDRADWATPVLFMRAPDGVLWSDKGRTGKREVPATRMDRGDDESGDARRNVSTGGGVLHTIDEGDHGAAQTAPAGPDLANLRRQLNRNFDDPSLDAFCLDHFPEVYDKLGRGLGKDEKITRLLDHCRRSPREYRRLITVLGG